MISFKQFMNESSKDVNVDDELLNTAEHETKHAHSLFKGDMESDQHGVSPGKLTYINQGLHDKQYSEDDIKNSYKNTRDLLSKRHGEHVTLYRADAPKSEHHPDNKVVYMGDKKLADRFSASDRKSKPYKVHVKHILAMNVHPSGYYEFIVKHEDLKHEALK